MDVVKVSESELVEALRQAAMVGGPHSTVPPDKRVPFPLLALPAVLRQFVQDTAEALGVAPECVATPAIATCATAIGNTYRIRVEPSGTEPSVMWAVTLLESDSSETPAYQAAVAPLVAEQESCETRYQNEKIRYAKEKQRMKTNLARWRREEEPEKPKEDNVLTSQGTVEALTTLLANNPRGLAMTHVELSGFFARLRSHDETTYLDFYNAGTVKRNRSNGKRIYVPAAALSIFGTCQPAVFSKAIGADASHRNLGENRLAARFILVSPESKPTPPQTRRESKPYKTGFYHDLINDLLAIRLPTDAHGRAEPTIVPMLPEAQECVKTFVTQHGPQSAAIGNPALRAHYVNLVAVAGRLALIFYLCDKVTQLAGQPLIPGEGGVQEQHMLAGIALARWYGLEATRVYAGGPIAKDRDVEELLELARGHGGYVTLGDMSRVKFRWRDPSVAEAVMRRAARVGPGKVLTPAPGSQGGRPSVRFVLEENGDDQQTPEKPENTEACR
jgi:hypothetical protein